MPNGQIEVGFDLIKVVTLRAVDDRCGESVRGNELDMEIVRAIGWPRRQVLAFATGCVNRRFNLSVVYQIPVGISPNQIDRHVRRGKRAGRRRGAVRTSRPGEVEQAVLRDRVDTGLGLRGTRSKNGHNERKCYENSAMEFIKAQTVPV
jgi:hypothetical protein